MEALRHTNLLNCADEVIQKSVRLEKIKDIVRKYVAHANQQGPTSFTGEKKESIDVVAAWRLLQKVKHALNEDSLQMLSPKLTISTDERRMPPRSAYSGPVDGSFSRDCSICSIPGLAVFSFFQ
jgi:hypothetical protein